MKLTSTTTSTTLLDLIEAQQPTAMQLIESKRIKNELIGTYGVELVYAGSEIYVETVLDTANEDSRPLTESLPIFAFNTMDLRNISVYGAGDFIISIV